MPEVRVKIVGRSENVINQALKDLQWDGHTIEAVDSFGTETMILYTEKEETGNLPF